MLKQNTMNPDKENIPQYRKLYELLRKHIVDGIYKEGDLLPSENELCQLHNLTRPTVRRALAQLMHEGFIKKHQGKGSIVSSLPKGIGILSISGTSSALGSDLKTEIIVKPEIRSWPDNFMFPLNDEEKEFGCIYMERLRLLKGQPVFYDINYLPNINLPRFTSRSFENKSLFDILRKFYQIEIKGGEQKLRANFANQQVSKYLKIETTHPILHLERRLDTNRYGFTIYSSMFCNTEEYALYGVF